LDRLGAPRIILYLSSSLTVTVTLIHQIEKVNQSYQTLWGVKSSLEEKVSMTNEQKKVLIKEVKTLRKKIEEVGSSNEELRNVNENLEGAVTELQSQLQSQKSRYEILLDEMTTTTGMTDTIGERDKRLGEGLVTDFDTALVQNALKASFEAKQHKGYDAHSVETTDGEGGTGGESSTPTHARLHIEDISPSSHLSRSSRHGSVDTSTTSTSLLPPPPLPVDLDGNAIEWDHETRQQMLQMDWLSPEQRNLLQDRQKEELPFHDSNTSSHENSLLGGGRRKSSLAQMTSNLFHLDKTEATTATGGATSTDHSSSTTEESKLSFRRFSAMFHSSSSTSAAPEHPPTSPTSAMKIEIPTSPSSPNDHTASQADTSTEGGRLTSSSAAPAPLCYRCGGTVEGPKYSTCKCEIPQMTPLVEESPMIDQFKGLFSKGKNAAKKAGNVVTGTLLKGRNEDSLTESSQHPSPPSEVASPASSRPAGASGGEGAGGTKMNLLSLDEPTAVIPSPSPHTVEPPIVARESETSTSATTTHSESSFDPPSSTTL
jgi:hypothetical protein